MSVPGESVTSAPASKRRVYLIHPKTAGAFLEAHRFDGMASYADAALPTVAALAPADKFEFEICDEYVAPVDFEKRPDFVGLTGKHGQEQRMREIAAEFRRRGVPVIFGGPFVTLAPAEMREHCDVLVLGELEAIAEEFFRELYDGSYKREYVGGRPSLDASPVPRWDLYPNERTLAGTLQTSRGCPFECEFCDVIQYAGRKQRHKSVEQVLRELDTLHALGYRDVLLADDNLTVFRHRAKQLLRGLADWNARAAEPISFLTQLSIEASADPEMLSLLREARVRIAFIGIETPLEASLRETKKRQNVGIDLVERMERFVRQGVQICAGVIVGFDNDGPDVFQRQLEFWQQSPIPALHVSQLYAAHATPLRARLEAAGRVVPEDYGAPSQGLFTNVIPAQMSREELGRGALWLMRQLYSVDSFVRRVLRLIELHPEGPEFEQRQLDRRPVIAEAARATSLLLNESREVARGVAHVFQVLRSKPSARMAVGHALFNWAQQLQRQSRVAASPDFEASPPTRVARASLGRALPVVS